MPPALAPIFTAIGSAIITSATALGLGVFLPAASAASIGLSAVKFAFAIGATLIGALFRPRPPRPEDVQASIRNPTSPRFRHYGIVFISGPPVFLESKSGNLHKVLALGFDRFKALTEILAYWIDDTEVTINVDGEVTTEPWDDNDPACIIRTRLGLATETYYSELEAVFSEWTSAHRGDGVASLYAFQRAVSAENISKVFPKLTETLYRVRAKGVAVWNPTDIAQDKDDPSTWEWSDNSALIALDYMRNLDGMRLPDELFTTTQAAAGWAHAIAVCDEAVPLKAGGTVARYRCSGSYSLNERPADVLGRILATCDGRIVPTPDGGVMLQVGEWIVPTAATIDRDTILNWESWGPGRNILETANTIRSVFTSEAHNFKSVDAAPWVNATDVGLRGEIATDIDLTMVPGHSQARRLMKIFAARTTPDWVGTLNCNMKALDCIGERFVPVSLPDFEVDEDFEVADARLIIGEGATVVGVTLDLQSIGQATYSWNAATEEGTAPRAETSDGLSVIPVPTGFTAVPVASFIGGVAVIVALLQWDAPPTAALTVRPQYKRTADSAWIDIATTVGATAATSPPLTDGESYDFQIAHRSLTGTMGAFTSPVITITAGLPWSLDFSTAAGSQYVLLLMY